MSTPTYQAFVEAIIAEPHDETHRLVCSDWLEDQGRSSEAQKFRKLPLTAALWCADWGEDGSLQGTPPENGFTPRAANSSTCGETRATRIVD